jgi:hypothetical protein
MFLHGLGIEHAANVDARHTTSFAKYHVDFHVRMVAGRVPPGLDQSRWSPPCTNDWISAYGYGQAAINESGTTRTVPPSSRASYDSASV